MTSVREVALEIVLISVVKAAEKQGVDLNFLLDIVSEVAASVPQEAPDRDTLIAAVGSKVSNAHAAVLTDKRVKTSVR